MGRPAWPTACRHKSLAMCMSVCVCVRWMILLCVLQARRLAHRRDLLERQARWRVREEEKEEGACV